MKLPQKAFEIYSRLKSANPDPKVELQYSTPFELLAATILSAQATDKMVNTLTPSLFAAFPTVVDFAKTDPETVDTYVNRVLFHKTKAKHIVQSARMIMEQFNGQVPKTMEQLLQLPGVARKTANVILGSIYGISQGIVVDTHCIRLSNKLGLTTSKDPVKIEQDLMKLLPKDTWIEFGHLITLHGRYVCKAKTHDCTGCPLGDLCPEYSGWKSA